MSVKSYIFIGVRAPLKLSISLTGVMHHIGIWYLGRSDERVLKWDSVLGYLTLSTLQTMVFKPPQIPQMSLVRH